MKCNTLKNSFISRKDCRKILCGKEEGDKGSPFDLCFNLEMYELIGSLIIKINLASLK
jgi:hypothetical protein